MKSFTPRDRSEVDIRVEQELKNHQEWKYQVGQSLNSLKKRMDEIAASNTDTFSKLSSDHKKLQIAMENLIQSTEKTVLSFSQRIGDLESKLALCFYEISELKNFLQSSFVSKVDHSNALAKIDSLFLSYDMKNTKKLDALISNFEILKGFLNKEVIQIRHDLAPKVPEIDPVEKLDEVSKIWKVDFEGVLKEISILKWSVHYEQKKIEHLYTLIERLKAGKA